MWALEARQPCDHSEEMRQAELGGGAAGKWNEKVGGVIGSSGSGWIRSKRASAHTFLCLLRNRLEGTQPLSHTDW